MKAEKLMNAIGGISDRHIVEFAEVKPVVAQKTMWIQNALIAACFCVAMMNAVLCIYNGNPGNQSHSTTRV